MIGYKYTGNLTRFLTLDKMKLFSERIDTYLKANKKYLQSLKILQNPPYSSLEELVNLTSGLYDAFEAFIIVGMGASILNPEAFVKFTGSKKITLIDTLDADHIMKILMQFNIKQTAVIFISKSGNTIETETICRFLIRYYKQHGVVSLEKYFYFILGKQKSKLRDLSEECLCKVIDHEDDIGGRYSVFTNVGFITALLCKFDIDDLIRGANEVLNTFFSEKESSYIRESVLFNLSMMDLNKSQNVFITYDSKLSGILRLHEQLTAESLGKCGIGITPSIAFGPNFQHTTLQLYLDGPKDKFFTFFRIQDEKEDIGIFSPLNAQLNRQCKEVLEYFDISNLPVKTVEVEDSANGFGSVMMHIIIETVITGFLLNINPFDQPAIEIMKLKLKTT